MRVEFSGGGPADGATRDVAKGTPSMKVYALTTVPGKWDTDPTALGPGVLPVAVHVYYKTDRLARDSGNRIFHYGGIEKRAHADH